MDLDRVTSLLAAGAEDGSAPSSECPDEHAIAAYVDGTLGAVGCEQLEAHAADCGHCLSLIGTLSRERGNDTSAPVAVSILAQVNSPASRNVLRSRWRFPPQWAVAAMLVLAVPLLVQIGRNAERGTDVQGGSAPAATRTSGSSAVELDVLSPAAGAAVDPRSLSITWSAIAGTPYYDVRIVTDAGDVVIQERVTGTAWPLPSQLHLRPGGEYYVRVDAYPAGDKTVSSAHVPFKVAE